MTIELEQRLQTEFDHIQKINRLNLKQKVLDKIIDKLLERPNFNLNQLVTLYEAVENGTEVQLLKDFLS